MKVLELRIVVPTYDCCMVYTRSSRLSIVHSNVIVLINTCVVNMSVLSLCVYFVCVCMCMCVCVLLFSYV